MNVLKRPLKMIESGALVTIVRFQTFIDHLTWEAAKLKAEAEVKPEEATSPEDMQERLDRITDIADHELIATQGGGSVMDLSDIQKRRGMWQWFTMFTTFYFSRARLTHEAARKTFVTKQSTYMEFAIQMLVLHWLPAVLSGAALDLLKGGDPDKAFDEAFEDAAFEPLQDWIGTREIVGMLKGYSYKGPAGAKLLVGVGALGHATLTADFDEHYWKKSLDAIGPALYLPTDQFKNFVEGTGAVLDGRAGPTAILFGKPPKR
jgi:hypothetical protein